MAKRETEIEACLDDLRIAVLLHGRDELGPDESCEVTFTAAWDREPRAYRLADTSVRILGGDGLPVECGLDAVERAQAELAAVAAVLADGVLARWAQCAADDAALAAGGV